jgi:anti-sigma factor RsiW
MSVDEEKLMAFADGELTGAERAEVEAALEHDAALRERLDAHRTIRGRLSSAFDSALDEPVPQRLLDAAQPREAEVIDIALGLVIGVGTMQQSQPMFTTADNGVVARGALSEALDTQLASDQAGAVRIGLSFRNQSGAYCRTFDLTAGSASGFACRQDSAWAVQLLSVGASSGEVRQAGASPEVLNAVDAIIAGDALDADAERAARDANWR